MFGKNGQIVDKYDKYNVYEDPYIDTPLYPKSIAFETDSGFKFGLAICFDINYLHPTQELLEKNVDAIIFQAAWVDELPFLTGLVFYSRIWHLSSSMFFFHFVFAAMFSTKTKI